MKKLLRADVIWGTLSAVGIVLAAALSRTGTLAPKVDAAPAEAPPGYCTVQICNKLERFTLDPSSWLMDWMGEACHDAVLPQQEAVEGKVLSSESRWYQGSALNPTKESVTRVKQVLSCTQAANSL